MRPQIRMGVSTYVEKNELAVCTASWIGILPRVWEKEKKDWIVPLARGSLQLVWEKDRYKHDAKQAYRYTPTCVGKSKKPLVYVPGIGGLLPLAWEKVVVKVHQFRFNRTTPTCVGKRIDTCYKNY